MSSNNDEMFSSTYCIVKQLLMESCKAIFLGKPKKNLLTISTFYTEVLQFARKNTSTNKDSHVTHLPQV